MPVPPSSGRVTSPYGWRIHPITGAWRFHYGEDTVGDGNYAAVSGTVVYAGYDNTGHGFGWAVGIRSSARPDLIVWTGHHASLSVSVGDSTVEGRTSTGPMGASGAATGRHVHTEFRLGGSARPGSGTAVNPRDFYNGGGGGGGGDTPIPEKKKEEEDDMPYLIYNPSSQHPDRRAWYVPGSRPVEITAEQATNLAGVLKQLKRITSTTPQADVTTQWTDTMWDTIMAVEPTIETGGGSGGSCASMAEIQPALDAQTQAITSSFPEPPTGGTITLT